MRLFQFHFVSVQIMVRVDHYFACSIELQLQTLRASPNIP